VSDLTKPLSFNLAFFCSHGFGLWFSLIRIANCSAPVEEQASGPIGLALATLAGVTVLGQKGGKCLSDPFITLPLPSE
jgi:hypothetical protein